ncbi:MAG: hypothetical protein ACLQU5_05285 [Isosphaeraceae bacterium]
MGDYLRLLTVNDRDVPLATLQRAVPYGAVWPVEHPGMLGNYLALGPEPNEQHDVWATVERNPVAPNTLGAEEVAEFIDSLDSGGPPSAVRWLSDYLETIRAIYAIRIYPEAILSHPDALDAVSAVRSTLHDAVGGIGQWDGHGFTNESDRLVWCDPRMDLTGKTRAAILDESTGDWIPFELDLDDQEELSAFLRGEIPKSQRTGPLHRTS